MNWTEDYLVHTKVQDLKRLLREEKITQDEYENIRVQRRRLLNRNYAKKCTNKKVAEVEDIQEKINKTKEELKMIQRKIIEINNQSYKINLCCRVMMNQTAGNVIPLYYRDGHLDEAIVKD